MGDCVFGYYLHILDYAATVAPGIESLFTDYILRRPVTKRVNARESKRPRVHVFARRSLRRYVALLIFIPW